MNQDDLKAVYFKCFDRLPQPWANQAKENFEPDRYQIHSMPNSILDHLECAFDWGASPQGFDYWNNIRGALLGNWNYLPVLPTDTSKVYEVACSLEDGSEWIELCTFDDRLGREADQAHNLFTRSTQNVTLNGLDLTPYAWREVPPVTIPPRPIINS